ncbi:hypothetical protein AC578_4512 [Pseudocercospora eumusae]|uniref:MOSC domain-containing protein n=1 Tax=Pseudocercospora eumusae TaxID=321146 RepID=A0A139GWE1_9PEZI|nr:hypothetical protein AC578_4512 [Pseudocercospora eumusae]
MFEHFVEHIRELLRNPRFWDGQVDKSGLLLIAVVIGVVSIGLYANMANTVDLTKDKINAAIATGQGVVDSKNRPPIPPPSEVISLRIYPIKSCRGIEIDSTRLKKSGLTLDRNWMFISKSDKKFLTIRGDPSMTLIDTNIIEGTDTFKGHQMLEISIHGTDGRVVIPAFPSEKWLSENTTLATVNIWDQDTDGYIYPDEINEIFSEFFSKPVALVYKGPTSRMVAINGRKELYGQETPHHFADVMSLQIASEASLKDLNQRLHLPSPTDPALTIERFRPNIIIRGRDSHPWEEDSWKRIRINTSIPSEEALYKIDLDVVARCARCQVPNVDPETAEKHPRQPWDTLMKFRRVDDGGPARWKPCFGMMCIPKSEGKIAVGATLEVLETTEKHLYDVRRFEEL